jgi:hypothetical protein
LKGDNGLSSEFAKRDSGSACQGGEAGAFIIATLAVLAAGIFIIGSKQKTTADVSIEGAVLTG